MSWFSYLNPPQTNRIRMLLRIGQLSLICITWRYLLTSPIIPDSPLLNSNSREVLTNLSVPYHRSHSQWRIFRAKFGRWSCLLYVTNLSPWWFRLHQQIMHCILSCGQPISREFAVWNSQYWQSLGGLLILPLSGTYNENGPIPFR